MSQHAHIFARVRVAALATAAVLLLTVCGDSPTEPIGERPLLADGDTVELEFRNSIQVDVSLASAIGQRLVVQMDGGTTADSLVARFVQDAVTFDSLIAFGFSGYPTQFSRWIPGTRSNSPMSVILRWKRRTGTPTVRVFLAAAGDQPEYSPNTLVPGDTVVESLDGGADVDAFWITGAPYSRVRVWVQADSAPEPFQLRATLHPFGETPSARTGPLATQFSEPLVMAYDFGPFAALPIVVDRVGTAPTEPFVAGYRLWIDQVDPLPESAAALLVPNDTVRELINGFGDVDRFTVPIAQYGEFRIILAQDSASSSPVYASVSNRQLVMTAADNALDLLRTPWIERDGDVPLLALAADIGEDGERLPVGYRVLYQERERAPEIAPAALGLRDSVTNETLFSCADTDDFTIAGPPLTMVAISAVLPTLPSCRVRVRLLNGRGELGALAVVPEGTDPDAVRWPELPIQASGELTFRIEGIDSVGQPLARDEDIAYRLDVYVVDSFPEIVPGELAAGDTLSTETIDRCSDRDSFVLTGTPGSFVIVGAVPSRETACGLFLTYQSGSGAVYRHADDEDRVRFGPLQMPASGEMRFAVKSERLGTSADRGAPYRLATEIVNPEPETADVIVAWNDTISEQMERCGDIDRFELPLEAGRALRLRIAPERLSTCRMVVSVFLSHDAGPGIPPTELNTLDPTYFYYEPFVTGTYILTVQSSASGSTADRALPYTLLALVEDNEVAAPVLAVGDTSEVEPYNGRYDLDRFSVPLVAGTEYVAATIGGEAWFTANTTGTSFNASFEPHARGRAMIFTQSATRVQNFRVGGLGDHTPPDAYRFTIHERRPAPEHIADTLHASDTTAIELVDYPVDEDELALVVSEGKLFRVQAFLTAPSSGTIRATVVSSTGSIITEIIQPGNFNSDRISRPANGVIGLKLRGFLSSADSSLNPGYRLRLIEIDPAPESIVAALPIGSAVAGEAIDSDPFDLDEFTFIAPSSGTFNFFLHAPTTCVDGDDRLLATLRDASGNSVESFASRTDTAASTSIALSAGATYRLTMEAAHPELGNCVLRAYELQVTAT